jgi:hypothetical protein
MRPCGGGVGEWLKMALFGCAVAASMLGIDPPVTLILRLAAVAQKFKNPFAIYIRKCSAENATVVQKARSEFTNNCQTFF